MDALHDDISQTPSSQVYAMQLIQYAFGIRGVNENIPLKQPPPCATNLESAEVPLSCDGDACACDLMSRVRAGTFRQ